MATTINRDAIDTFMSITGASEPVALQRLEAYGGNLNEAINAHFSEGDRNPLQDVPVRATAAMDDLMDVDEPPEFMPRRPSSLLSATRGLNPFSILDPTGVGRNFFDSGGLFEQSSGLTGRTPFVSHPREVRQIPIEVRDGPDPLGTHSGHGPRIEEVTDAVDVAGPEIRGTVVIDDEDDDMVRETTRGGGIAPSYNIPDAPQFDNLPGVPRFDTVPDGTDIEEEMIRAAIEASKRDAELQNQQELPSTGPQQMPTPRDEIAHAVSLSLKTAEEERLRREQGIEPGSSGSSADKTSQLEELGITDVVKPGQGVGSSDDSSTSHKKEIGSSSIQDDVEELDELPLVRHRSRRQSSSSGEVQREVGETEVSPVTASLPSDASQTQPNGNAFPSDEWGGISSEEHDEAVMLEAAMFGGVPEGGFNVPYAPHQFMRPGINTSWRSPRPPSPGLAAQRSIREQQDDEYLAALEADREKELIAMEEERAAREAALEERRQKEEESRRKLEQEQELERQLAAKEASLPQEPLADEENTVTLLVRMPDGSRRGRRFLKSDKLQCLFDFIDIGRWVKPGTYRMVRPYPRQAFGDGECNKTMSELGLTSKQEALFLELI